MPSRGKGSGHFLNPHPQPKVSTVNPFLNPHLTGPMLSTHTIRISLDEGTGQVSGVHRCTVEIGGHSVVHSRKVALPDSVADALTKFIDHNRSEVEVEAEAMAIAHAAAVSGRTQPGVKALKVEGGVSLFGEGSSK